MEKDLLVTQFNSIVNNTEDLEVWNTFYNTIKDRIDFVSASEGSTTSAAERQKKHRLIIHQNSMY